MFLRFPYLVPVSKNCVIFIGCNLESRSSQVAIAQAEKRYCVSKGGKNRAQGARALKRAGSSESSCDARVWVLPKRQNKVADI